LAGLLSEVEYPALLERFLGQAVAFEA